MKIMPLGVKAGGSVHPNRHPSASIFECNGEYILVDAGEGTQFQLCRYSLPTHKITTICITHLHPDHILGLFGLLANYASESRQSPVTILGPVGIRRMIDVLSDLTFCLLDFPLHIIELESGSFGKQLTTKTVEIHCTENTHKIPSFAYKFIERVEPKIDIERVENLQLSMPDDIIQLRKEKTIIKNFSGAVSKKITLEDIITTKNPRTLVISGDTRYCQEMITFANNATVLIHESTYKNSDEVLAHERYHSTAGQAAKVARESNVGRLYLTHFSNRYLQTHGYQEEARALFPNSFLCCEGEWITL